MSKLTAKTNVVKFYKTSWRSQLDITAWLRANANVGDDVYFDDADLVWVDQTIVPCALVNKKLTMQDLLDAVVKASA
jgi:hypothetical protein